MSRKHSDHSYCYNKEKYDQVKRTTETFIHGLHCIDGAFSFENPIVFEIKGYNPNKIIFSRRKKDWLHKYKFIFA